MLELKQLMLGPPGLWLGLAESMTCGRVQSAVGSVSGASQFLSGGITAYQLGQKVRHLGVDRAEAEKVNSVSSAVAEQMALGACTFFNANVGLATTGYAEPSPQWNVKVPFAFWGLAQRRDDGSFFSASGRVECIGASRVQCQEKVALAALQALKAHLRSWRIGESKRGGR